MCLNRTFIFKTAIKQWIHKVEELNWLDPFLLLYDQGVVLGAEKKNEKLYIKVKTKSL